ncbi:RNA polymerase subunit sigma [Streptomyces sp. NPDC002265]|uniref:RNA polymerase subunit sigma n=1 Tax=Streptomyces sp. NPDC002265 TaxID=3154415 RepID=UPI00332290DE
MGRAGDVVPIAELLDEQRHLLDVASLWSGSSIEAESVVDEVYRRWYELPDTVRARIAEPRSWLARTAGDICLARPAPSGPDHGAGPGAAGAHGARAGVRHAGGTREERISRVLLNAAKATWPAERAAFVLKDVFGAVPRPLTGIASRTEPERMEPAGHARRGVRARRSRSATPKEHDAVARAVGEACAAADSVLLESLLHGDASAFFDGGGKVRAPAGPVHGSGQVARGLLTLLARDPHTTLTPQSVNGRTGLVVRYDHQVAAVISLGIADHHVVQVAAVLNPDKLRHWNRPAGRTVLPGGPGPAPAADRFGTGAPGGNRLHG